MTMHRGLIGIMVLVAVGGCQPKEDRVYVSAAELYRAGESKPVPVAEKEVLNVPIFPGAKTPKGYARVVKVNEGMSSALLTVGDSTDSVENFYQKKLAGAKVSRNAAGSMIEGMGPDGKFVYVNLSRKSGLTFIAISIFSEAPTAEAAPKAGDLPNSTDNSGINGPIGNG